MDDYRVRRDKWYKDPNNLAILRKLNKDRKKHGKQRIHMPSSITASTKKPLTPFFRSRTISFTSIWICFFLTSAVDTCKNFAKQTLFPERILLPALPG